MRATIPINLTSDLVLSSTAAVVHTQPEYDSATNYAASDLVSIAAEYAIYQSTANANLGKAPATSPAFWKKLGPTEAPYDPYMLYEMGATVSLNDRVYESLQGSNIGNTPIVLPLTGLWWLDVGPTNRSAMFDIKTNTKTTAAESLSVTVKPLKRVNTLGLAGMQANTVTITAYSAYVGAQVYGPVVVTLATRVVANAWDYAFEPFSTTENFVVFDLPQYSDLEITVVLSAPGGICVCGTVVVGDSYFLGSAQYGAKNEDLNFSTITRDAFGTATLIPRTAVPKADVTLITPKSIIGTLRKVRQSLDGVAGLYTGVDDATSDWFDMLFVIGVYRSFAIDASNFSSATISMQIEGI